MQNSFALGKKAWELYLERNIVDPRLVRAAVAKSWQRCRELKVDPFKQVDPTQGGSGQFEDRIYRRQQLIRIAKPFMRDLYQVVSGSPFQVILTDEEGFLLHVVGDKAIAARTQEVHLCAGGLWTEAQKGTNAIGTAIAEKGAVQIWGWEHFCQDNHFLTCSAAPIKDALGTIIGVLDASGDCRQANPHTIGMVVATVRAIENQLRLEAARQQLYVESRYASALLKGVADGVIAVDSNGIVTELNALGGEILGIAPAAAKGQPLIQVCSGNPKLIEQLSNSKDSEVRDVLERAGKRILSSASALRDENGQVVGTIAFMHELGDGQNARTKPVHNLCQHTFDDMIAESPAMIAAKEWAMLAANCSSNVLLLGESGTGKEMFANAIHNASARRYGPFVALNCAAMPESLVESELFGYVEGSFTGARKGGHPGKFEAANGGTIFLDEIGEMSPSVQAKLLRVLQDARVARVGSAQEIKVDIRIIAATHCDLNKAVKQGSFREDLFYRLDVLEIMVPPLRERGEDIPRLARCLVNKVANRLRRKPPELDDLFLQKLGGYSWPGNVREMENAIERAIVHIGERPILIASDLDLRETQAPHSETNIEAVPENATPIIRPLREVEKQAIIETLAHCRGNIKKTAALLGIARNTLYRKMQEHDLLSGEEMNAAEVRAEVRAD